MRCTWFHRVNFPHNSCCVLDLVWEEYWKHWCFHTLLRNQGLFPISHIQLKSRCAGAGREQSQADSPGWPMEIFHTMDAMLSLWAQVGWGAATFPWVQWVPGVWWVQRNTEVPWNPRVLWVPWLLLRDWLGSWWSGSEKSCIAYCLFCVFCCCCCYYDHFFLCCLIILSLSQPTSFTFWPFSSPSHCGGRRERVNGWLVLVAGCWVKPKWEIIRQ